MDAGEVVELVDVLTERLQVAVQSLAEASVLRTLASEAESDLGRDHRDRAVRLLVLRLQRVDDLVDVGQRECDTVVVLDAASSQGVRE